MPGVSRIPDGLIEALTPFFCRREDGCGGGILMDETSDQTDRTTAETSATDLTNATLTITTTAICNIELTFNGIFKNETTGFTYILITDSANNVLWYWQFHPGGINDLLFSPSLTTVDMAVAAGANTYKVRWYVSGSSAVMYQWQFIMKAIPV